MALTQQETAFLTQLKKEGKSVEEQTQALKKMREGGNSFVNFFQGVGKEAYNIGSQLSRLAPGDQSADPTSFYSRAQRDMKGADIERARAGYNPEALSSKAGGFTMDVAATLPLGMGTGAISKGLVGLGLKVSPKIASKALPFVQASKGVGNIAKFGAFEGAKDVATYDMLTKGETSLKSVATGAVGGAVLGPALYGAGKLIKGTPGAISGAIKQPQKIVSSLYKTDEVPGIITAIKPKQKVKNGIVTRSMDKIKQEVSLANNLIKSKGAKPKNLAEYNSSIKEIMRDLGSQIEAKTKQKLFVNLNTTAQKLDDLARNPALQRLDPSGVNEIKKMAQRLKMSKGNLKVEDAEFMNQFINDELGSIPTASESRKKALQIIVGDLRDKLDEAISKLPGEFKDLKKQYGALRNVYGDGISREIVYNRANPEGLISSYSKIEGGSDVVSGLLKIMGMDIRGGAADIGKGLAKNKIGQFVKTRNDPNNIIFRIFNDSNTPNTPVSSSVPRVSPVSSNTSGTARTTKVKPVQKIAKKQETPKIPVNTIESSINEVKNLIKEGKKKK